MSPDQRRQRTIIAIVGSLLAVVLVTCGCGAALARSEPGPPDNTAAGDTRTAEPPVTASPSPEPSESAEPSPIPTLTEPPPTTSTAPPRQPTKPSTKPKPPTKTTPKRQPQRNCDPSYPGVCIPPAPPDLDCGDIPYKNFRVSGADPHRFDRDRNGIGCES